jgi:hypothetical protein
VFTCASCARTVLFQVGRAAISVADGCIVTAGVVSEQRASVAAETRRNMLLTSAVDVPHARDSQPITLRLGT